LNLPLIVAGEAMMPANLLLKTSIRDVGKGAETLIILFLRFFGGEGGYIPT